MKAVIKDAAAFYATLLVPRGGEDVTISVDDRYGVTVRYSWGAAVEVAYHSERKPGERWDCRMLTLNKASIVPADVAEPGAFSIDADSAARLAKSIKLAKRGEEVELSQVKKSLVAQIGSRSVTVSVGEPEPPRVVSVGSRSVVVPLRLLRAVIGYRTPCEDSIDLSRWVAVEARTTGTTAMWTDGAQMSVAEGDPDLPAPRVCVPVAAVRSLLLLDGDTPVDIADGELRCGPVGDPTCTVAFDLHPPRYPSESVCDTLRQAPGYYARIRTTSRTVTEMLNRLRACTHEEVVLSARGGVLRMLAYDRRGVSGKGKKLPWDTIPRAETWEEVDIDGKFSRTAVDAARLRDLCTGDGECTIWILDGDSPVHIHNASTGIKTVLMPMEPSYDKVTTD